MKRLTALVVLSILLPALACSSGDPAGGAAGSASQQLLSADGVAIEYEVHGAGPLALVFIHGWICERSHWHRQIESFASDHTVVTLDLGGHGASGSGREGWPFSRFADDVQAVVERLDLTSVILVGHSMGGHVALAAAARMPDRVLGVVGADTLHDVEAVIDPDSWEQLMGQYEADFGATCSRFVEYMFSEPTSDAELKQFVHESMCSADPEMAVAVGRQLGALDQAALLAAAGVPVRCINSTKSGRTDIEANRRHGDFDATFIDGAGHFLMLERPDEFNRLLADALEELTGF